MIPEKSIYFSGTVKIGDQETSVSLILASDL